MSIYNLKEVAGIFHNRPDSLVSVFENIFAKEPCGTIGLREWFLSDRFKEKVIRYRNCLNGSKKIKMKKEMPCITPSGVFQNRLESSLIHHSGYVCIDVDRISNRIFELDMAKQQLGAKYPSLYYAGLSISGQGLCLIFRILDSQYHHDHYAALIQTLNKDFSVLADPTCKNIARLRIASYDPFPYFNVNAIPFDKVSCAVRTSSPIRILKEAEQIRKDVEILVRKIRETHIDITNDYGHWFKIGCAIASEFGEEGRCWFHWISRMSSKYYEADCDIQYSKCLKYKNNQTSIATFFYYCKQVGIMLPQQSRK